MRQDADVDEAVVECALGSLSYNGQRCTAIKQIMVHKDIAEDFLVRLTLLQLTLILSSPPLPPPWAHRSLQARTTQVPRATASSLFSRAVADTGDTWQAKFTAKVGSMKLGLPWEAGVDLTPLPEPNKPQYLIDLCADAEAKGAQIISPGSSQGWGHTTVFPSIAFPVNKDMRVMQEEQFGPLIPIATFSAITEVEEYVMDSDFGQQAAVFSRGTDAKELGALLDVLTHNVARVNLNCQCQRSPDNFPFTGRKSSALGTLSVTEALKVCPLCVVAWVLGEKENRQRVTTVAGVPWQVMSMESLVATKRKNEALVAQLADSKCCKFLSRI